MKLVFEAVDADTAKRIIDAVDAVYNPPAAAAATETAATAEPGPTQDTLAADVAARQAADEAARQAATP